MPQVCILQRSNPQSRLQQALSKSHVFREIKQITKQNRSVCERKRCCAMCGWVMTRGNHECNKLLCDNCKKKKEIGHLCYMRPLKEELPPLVLRYCTSFMISKRPKIPSTRPRQSYTYLTSSVCSSSVRDARTWKTPCDAVRGSTRSGKIMWGTCFHT